MTWLDKILASTIEFESPERFFWWSGISAISAVCRRNIYLNRFAYILYPNTYVLLIGPSGIKKSVPVGLAERLVRKVDSTRIYSGRGTIQGIIKDLARVHTNKDKKVSKDAKCFVVSGEFDAMLVNDPHAYSLITDLYDTHFKDEWKNVIKGAGTDELKNIYMVILAASNEDNLALALPTTAEKGGLIARTSIVLEEEEKCENPLTRAPKIVPDIVDLSKRLTEITNISGEFKWTEEARIEYETWYGDLKRIAKTDKTGTLNRLHDTVLKVAMCISLGYKDDLELLKVDILEAISACERCIPDMKRVFLGHGKHITSEVIKMVLKTLLVKSDHKVSRKHLLSNLYGIGDAADLDRVVDHLTQSGAIISEREGTDIVYILNEGMIRDYQTLKMREAQ